MLYMVHIVCTALAQGMQYNVAVDPVSYIFKVFFVMHINFGPGQRLSELTCTKDPFLMERSLNVY